MISAYPLLPHIFFPLCAIKGQKYPKNPIHFGKVISVSRGLNPYPSDIWCGFGRCSDMMKKYSPDSIGHIHSFGENQKIHFPFSDFGLFLAYFPFFEINVDLIPPYRVESVEGHDLLFNNIY